MADRFMDELGPLLTSAVSAGVELRHRLHQTPELAYQEVETAGLIRESLSRLGIDFTPGPPDAPTATVAVLGDTSKPCVALRADIDALPILEQTGLPYASRRQGFMHACGHDGHSANLVAAAAVLQKIAPQLDVCVKLIWQPAEEGGGGAERLVRAGVLDGSWAGPRVSAIFGLHGWPGIPVGMVSTRAGPLLAATDTFAITFRGKGTHGAYPHFGIDPIVAACEYVASVQAVVSRECDPTESAVVTVGQFHAGTAVNIIPDEARLELTARTLTDATRTTAREAIVRRAKGVAAATRCEVRIDHKEGYPATTNDARCAGFVETVARQVVGGDRFLPADRASMGGEDFAFYLEQVPGCFFLIGLLPPGASSCPSLHTERFDFTDAAMETGTRMFVELVRRAGRGLLGAGAPG